MEKAMKNEYDLILTDVRMPVRNGAEPPKAPDVFVIVMQKTFSSLEFLSKVRKMLGHKRGPIEELGMRAHYSYRHLHK